MADVLPESVRAEQEGIAGINRMDRFFHGGPQVFLIPQGAQQPVKFCFRDFSVFKKKKYRPIDTRPLLCNGVEMGYSVPAKINDIFKGFPPKDIRHQIRYPLRGNDLLNQFFKQTGLFSNQDQGLLHMLSC